MSSSEWYSNGTVVFVHINSKELENRQHKSWFVSDYRVVYVNYVSVQAFSIRTIKLKKTWWKERLYLTQID